MNTRYIRKLDKHERADSYSNWVLNVKRTFGLRTLICETLKSAKEEAGFLLDWRTR